MEMYNYINTNVFDICCQTIKDNGLYANKRKITTRVLEHPFPNSLTAITDILGEHNISTTSYSIKTSSQLLDLSKVFIALVYIDSIPYFCIVYSIDKEEVIWYNPIRHMRESISFKLFSRQYGGISTIIDKNDRIEEKIDKKEQIKDFVSRFVEAIPLVIIGIFVVLLSFSMFSLSSIWMRLYVLGIVAGSIVCGILLRYEINDYHSNLVEKLCPSGKKFDCSTLLQSKGNNIFGISWVR